MDDAATQKPTTSAEAIAALNTGNSLFALDSSVDTVPVQEPFAAALGCSDARVPLELVFGCGVGDIFVTRVAGNVPGPYVIGSLEYSVRNLPSVEALFVLGHSHCGAVTKAVDAMLEPSSYIPLIHHSDLRGLIDAILPSVRLAQAALEEHGPSDLSPDEYREALIDVAVAANAALSAQELGSTLGRTVHFGVHDLRARSVGVRQNGAWRVGLQPAPGDGGELQQLLAAAARSQG